MGIERTKEDTDQFQDFLARVHDGPADDDLATLRAQRDKLLEACRAANNMLANVSHYVPDEEFEDEPNVNTVRDALDAAIAFAEGGAPSKS